MVMQLLSGHSFPDNNCIHAIHQLVCLNHLSGLV